MLFARPYLALHALRLTQQKAQRNSEPTINETLKGPNKQTTQRPKRSKSQQPNTTTAPTALITLTTTTPITPTSPTSPTTQSIKQIGIVPTQSYIYGQIMQE